MGKIEHFFYFALANANAFSLLSIMYKLFVCSQLNFYHQASLTCLIGQAKTDEYR